MRLRLSVERNNLPTTKIVWNIPETKSLQAYTVARLLEDVNNVLPLEAEQWGLEDYIVEIGGFECFHFSPVLGILKEDDHVCIRPLLTAEVRSRTLCGRYQIAEDGRRLVDGIPFGRPYLRQPKRPAIRIPPPKRRRIEEDTMAGVESAEVSGYITADENPSLSLSWSPTTNGSPNPAERRPSRSRKDNKTVRFAESRIEELDDSEDDEEFAPSDSDESENSNDSIIATPADSRADSTSIASGHSADASDSSSDEESDSSSEEESEEESDSSSDASSSNCELESVSFNPGPIALLSHTLHNMEAEPSVPPGAGSQTTKRRNARRRESEKLRRLKECGTLHQDANLEDLRNYQEASGTSTPEPAQEMPSETTAASVGKRKRVDKKTTEQDDLNESAELTRRKQDLMAKFGGETPVEDLENVGSPKPASTSSKKVASPTTESATPPNAGTKRSGGTSEPPAKRLRPDTSAIGRILRRQAINVDKKSKAKAAPAVEQPTEPEGASDPDFWKSKIKLSAFECWDEEFELSSPPFPFQQHWDPASKLMREKMNKNKQKKGGRRSSARIPAGAAEDEETLILDYDDSPETLKQDSDPTAAIESQLMQDVQVAAKDDLPPLPEDVDTLTTLDPADIKVGAIVAFKLWVIDPETVTPQFSQYKTAVVEKEGDSGNGAGTFRLKLAERDIPKREQGTDDDDDAARNTAEGFQLGENEDEVDESVWEGTFVELISPKLLKAAE